MSRPEPMDKGTAYRLGKEDYKAGRPSNPGQVPLAVEPNYWGGWDDARVEDLTEADERRTKVVDGLDFSTPVPVVDILTGRCVRCNEPVTDPREHVCPEGQREPHPILDPRD